MQYLLSEEEMAARVPVEEMKKVKETVTERDSALVVAREMLLVAAGEFCIHDPKNNSLYRYCDGCPCSTLEIPERIAPLTSLSHKLPGYSIELGDPDERRRISRLICPLPRKYSK